MIRIKTVHSEDSLFGKSKWWGCPDLPDDLEYPEVPVNEDGELYYDPLTFICQIRCEDLEGYDTEGLLPKSGMLYFFAALDYFLGNIEHAVSPQMGEWSPSLFRVLYTKECENLHSHSVLYDDGTPAYPSAEKIVFGSGNEETRLLGEPYFDEVREEMGGMISLLQIDENDSWNLRFFDSGMLNFLIYPKDLAKLRFDRVRCYLHSF